MKTIIKTIPILLVVLMGLTSSAPVQAGGYDTPILYSARHMGMGGTAISFVDDPSALFHNPAGLSHTKFISLTTLDIRLGYGIAEYKYTNKQKMCYFKNLRGRWSVHTRHLTQQQKEWAFAYNVLSESTQHI